MQIYIEVYRQTQDWCLDDESHAILLSKTICNDLGLLLIITSFFTLSCYDRSNSSNFRNYQITGKQNQSSCNLLHS